MSLTLEEKGVKIEGFGEKHADMVANISDEDKAAWKTDAEAKFSAAPDA